MSEPRGATGSGELELRILDDRGCLTAEAAVLADQLLPDQRAVVERHVRGCTVCAQQHTALARATERFRRARPRLQLPAEVRQIARQIALRGLTVRRPRPAATTARLRAVKGRLRYSDLGRSWYRSRAFWIATLTALGTALLLSIAALLVLRFS